MTYEQAKLIQEDLNNKYNYHSDIMDKFPRGEMGLVDNEVRKSEEYQIAKSNLDKSFQELRQFNVYFMKAFKKEYTKERSERRKRIQR